MKNKNTGDKRDAKDFLIKVMAGVIFALLFCLAIVFIIRLYRG